MIDGRRVLAICIVLSVLRIKKRGYFLKKRNYEFCLLYASSWIGRQDSVIWCHSPLLIKCY